MKTGILTFQDSYNCGALLQAYALKETVKSIQEDVEILNYKRSYTYEKGFHLDKKNIKTLFKSIYFIITHPHKIIIEIRMSRFRKKYFNLTSMTNKKDIYVVGSDQVWNTHHTDYDKSFFLDFCPEKSRKISYAASLGEDTIDEQQKEFLRKNIKNIDYISVREDSAVKILSELTKKKIYRTLDPTLLADKNIWDELTRKKTKHEYILLYRIQNNKEVFRIADAIAEKLNLKVLFINNFKKAIPGYKNIRNIGPREFLTLFKHASFIVTNSFHGTAFSIIYNKNFVTVSNPTRGTRIENILHSLKLSNRLITDSSQINEQYPFKIDYDIPNKLLEIEKEKSKSFLIRAIEGKLPE